MPTNEIGQVIESIMHSPETFGIIVLSSTLHPSVTKKIDLNDIVYGPNELSFP